MESNGKHVTLDGTEVANVLVAGSSIFGDSQKVAAAINRLRDATKPADGRNSRVK